MFDSAALRIFRRHYPKGRNYLITPSGEPAYFKAYDNHEVMICTPAGL
jgi:hypothetical protein